MPRKYDPIARLRELDRPEWKVLHDRVYDQQKSDERWSSIAMYARAILAVVAMYLLFKVESCVGTRSVSQEIASLPHRYPKSRLQGNQTGLSVSVPTSDWGRGRVSNEKVGTILLWPQCCFLTS